jgi:hypothetical protein
MVGGVGLLPPTWPPHLLALARGVLGRMRACNLFRRDSDRRRDIRRSGHGHGFGNALSPGKCQLHDRHQPVTCVVSGVDVDVQVIAIAPG